MHFLGVFYASLYDILLFMCKKHFSIRSLLFRRDSTIIDHSPEGFYLPAHRRIGTSMIHRPDIVWIDSGNTKEEILEIIRNNPGLHWFPVCANTVDSVLGILSDRDFLESLTHPSWSGLRSLVQRPLYLPETITIARAFSLLEENNCPLALVIDEWGGIEGMITSASLVSDLLKEFQGEETEEDPDLFKREDGSYLVAGQVRMDDIRELFDIEDTGEKNYYTLAGFLLALNGSIPKTGDRIICGSYQFEIVDMDGHRIDKVLISKMTEMA